jgi:predicted transcriptional regulator
MNTPTPTKTRRTHEAAEIRAREVHALRALGYTQKRIAMELGLSREAVAKYLSPMCKAALRAGLFDQVKENRHGRR